MNIKNPDYVNQAMRLLEASGFEAYCVGGCVRDSLLGLSPFDWDITTSATTEEMKQTFADMKTIETGIKHGTITVIIDSHSMEITTYRIDGDYLDSRHPESVSFSRNLHDDLSRRDFTINAMAYNEKNGLVDLFDGRADLERRLIRCVGDADKRFDEDALRIMRCVRFSAQLGFSIEDKTHKAAVSKRFLLKKISAERIATELSKLTLGDFAVKTLRENSEIIFTILPELQAMKGCEQENPYHIYDVWEHTLHAIEHTPKDLATRLAVLFHDSGKLESKSIKDGTAHFYGHALHGSKLCETALNRLRFPKKEVAQISRLVLMHEQILPLSRKRIKKLLITLGTEDFDKLMAIIYADVSAQAPLVIEERRKMLSEAQDEAKRILSEGLPLSVKDLKISGDTLLALGFEPGEKIGACLNELFDLVVNEQVPNEPERLMEIAKRRL